MKMLKNRMSVLSICQFLVLVTTMAFVVMFMTMKPSTAGEHRKAPSKEASKPKKRNTAQFIEMTASDESMLVSCKRGVCWDMRTEKMLGRGPDGYYVGYYDTPSNRAKSAILGAHVLFISMH